MGSVYRLSGDGSGEWVPRPDWGVGFRGAGRWRRVDEVRRGGASGGI